MIDFGALLYGPAYDLLGVPATITPADYGKPVAVTAIDKTSGQEVQDGKTGTSTIRPAAVIRMRDLTAAGLTRADVRRATFEMNGKCWRVESTQPKLTGGGEANGELALILAEMTA